MTDETHEAHESDPVRRPAGPPDDLERPEWWATLSDDALRDETRANRRAEWWVLATGLLAMAITVALLLWWGEPG
ncbi:hypothetical protein [Nocardioides sp. YIM 152588]|uniref:hypothetical protein n=1 Tax=Nocardioides sp. YIM 152588 TaxID=3158259 RepID=UPI0032E472D1